MPVRRSASRGKRSLSQQQQFTGNVTAINAAAAEFAPGEGWQLRQTPAVSDSPSYDPHTWVKVAQPHVHPASTTEKQHTLLECEIDAVEVDHAALLATIPADDVGFLQMAQAALKDRKNEVEALMLANDALDAVASSNGLCMLHALGDGRCYQHTVIVCAAAEGISLEVGDTYGLRRRAAEILRQAAVHGDIDMRAHYAAQAEHEAQDASFEHHDEVNTMASSYAENLLVEVHSEDGESRIIDPRTVARAFGLPAPEGCPRGTLRMGNRTTSPRHWNPFVSLEAHAAFVARSSHGVSIEGNVPLPDFKRRHTRRPANSENTNDTSESVIGTPRAGLVDITNRPAVSNSSGEQHQSSGLLDIASIDDSASLPPSNLNAVEVQMQLEPTPASPALRDLTNQPLEIQTPVPPMLQRDDQAHDGGLDARRSPVLLRASGTSGDWREFASLLGGVQAALPSRSISTAERWVRSKLSRVNPGEPAVAYGFEWKYAPPPPGVLCLPINSLVWVLYPSIGQAVTAQLLPTHHAGGKELLRRKLSALPRGEMVTAYGMQWKFAVEPRVPALPLDETERHLAELYAVTSSRISAHSRLLAQYSDTSSPMYLRAAAAVLDDIDDFVRVTDADAERCRDAYMDTMSAEVHVCATCGCRDPDAHFESKVLNEATVDSEHWVVVPPEPLRRLQSQPPILLFKESEGALEPEVVEVFPIEFRNVYLCPDGRAYHIIAEAVQVQPNGDLEVMVCASCRRAWDKPTTRMQRGDSAKHDSFDDLYTSTGAPDNSIASGDDYGRQSFLPGRGIVRPSTIEMLVLADARMHSVVVKVVAPGGSEATSASRLTGHTIIFPQARATPRNPEAPPTAFTEDAIRAALKSVAVRFVGPAGSATALEKAALKVSALRLRPGVVFNYFAIRAVLHGRPAPPPLHIVQAWLKDATSNLVKEARHITNDAVERAAAPSDIANVRSGASKEAREEEENADVEFQQQKEAAAHGDDSTGLEPDMIPIGALVLAQQTMAAVVDGIANAFGVSATNPPQAPAGALPVPGLAMQRGQDPIDDYTSASEGIYGAFWPLFLLRRGLQEGRALSDKRIRHLFLYFDARFAHDLPLLFNMADIKMRHAVNKAVGARVKTNSNAYREFAEVVADPQFLVMLEEAQRDPKGEAGRAVLKKVVRFLNLTGSHVPWGNQERKGEVTKLMAHMRYNGTASYFVNYAPDDVHDTDAIKFSHPHVARNVFPATSPDAFLEALRGATASERTVVDDEAPGGVFKMDERSLQQLAVANPVACTIAFERKVKAMNSHLLGLKASLTSTPILGRNDRGPRRRQKGVLGMPVEFSYVKENNKRCSSHIHGLLQGGSTPAMIAQLAHDPRLSNHLLSAMETQIQTELPLTYHAVDIMQSILRVSKRRDAAVEVPLNPAGEAFAHHSQLVRVNRHTHRHQLTCTSGVQGMTGCRMCVPYAHGSSNSSCSELTVFRRDAQGQAQLTPNTAPGVEFRCPVCYADGALQNPSLSSEERVAKVLKEDNRRTIAYTATMPPCRHSCAGGGSDARILALELKRPHLPDPNDRSIHADQLRLAQESRKPVDITGRPARVLLAALLAGEQPLGALLQKPGLEALRARLDHLSSVPADVDAAGDNERVLQGEASLLIRNLTDPSLTCRNGIIADAVAVLSGCTGSNAVVYSLGAGSGSKSTGMYSIKYICKDSVEIQAAASVLVDAAKHVRAHPSTAADSGENPRTAKHFAQRVLNSNIELDGTQAAGVVLNHLSSGHSDETSFFYAWNLTKRAVAWQSNDTKVDTQIDDDVEVASMNSEAGGSDEDEDDFEEALADAVGDGDENALGACSLGGDDRQPNLDDAGKVIDHEARALVSTSRTGHSSIYTRPDGTQVPVSSAVHYHFRDVKLRGLNGVEFCLQYEVRKLDANDKKWRTLALAEYECQLAAGQAVSTPLVSWHQVGAGRPKVRALLLQGHPLADSHILVKRAKYGVPAFAGAPPPKDPPVRAVLSAATKRKQREFARYYGAIFIPWGVHDPPRLKLRDWRDWTRRLEATANAFPIDEDGESRQRRYIAHGRLAQIENVQFGFTVNQATAVALAKHRGRARSLWKDDGSDKPGCGQIRAPDEAQRSAMKELADLHAKADRMRGSADLVSRLKRAATTDQWGAQLTSALPSALLRTGSCSANVADRAHGQDTAAAPERLKRAWPAAAEPANRTAAPLPSFRNVREINKALLEPLPPRGPAPASALGDMASRADGQSGNQRPGEVEGSIGPGPSSLSHGPLAEISGADYEEKAALWSAAADVAFAAGRPMDSKPPLNPEQRSVGRKFLSYVHLRTRMMAEGSSASEINAAAKAADIPPVIMLIGPGGSGKSASVYEIEAQMNAVGAQLLVTAYTGVAVAPFGGPTLLSLMNMQLESKSNKTVRLLNQDQLLATKEKFYTESGLRIENVGGIAIDEVSFNDSTLFGHVDGILRQITGNRDVPFGGIPLLLLGDNKQKPPPGGLPWYKALVKRAQNRGAIDGQGPSAAATAGLDRLADAPLVELFRMMRAKDDPEFADAQRYMRRTDVDQPVSCSFLKRLGPVSAADLENEPEWAFAPIGVLSTFERNTLNLAQIREFARAFDIPLVRWRLRLDCDLPLDESEISAIYDNEPEGLWGYFAEGAPVHLTQTIKAVRKLVNGSPGLLDSLTFVDGAVPLVLQEAYERGGFQEVTLQEGPVAVNVRVGACTWHGVELDDISHLITSVVSGAPVVPVLIQKRGNELVALRSTLSAQLNVDAVKVKVHAFMLAFALTDFKLQGRTLPRIILSICYRPIAPFMDLASFYVLISRVRSFMGLRLLHLDLAALNRLAELQWPPEMYAWEQGYGGEGFWSDERAAAAMRVVQQARAATAAAAKKAALEKKVSGKAASAAKKRDKRPAASTATSTRKRNKTTNENSLESTTVRSSVLTHGPLVGSMGPASLFNNEARTYEVNAGEWTRVRSVWASTNASNQSEPMPGYNTTGRVAALERQDYKTLMQWEMLKSAVLHEIAYRVVLQNPAVRLVSSFVLEKMCPLALGKPGDGQQPSVGFWERRFGDASIGGRVGLVTAIHYVPGHWCLVVADFVRRQLVYYDPCFNSPSADQPLLKFREFLQLQCDQQGYTAFRPIDAAAFPVVKFNATPRQPDGVSCGVCVLLMLELLARDPDEFYARARDGTPWRLIEIIRARAKWACELLVYPLGVDASAAQELQNTRDMDESAELMELQLTAPNPT